MNNKKNLKSIVFAMVLAAGMLLPASGFAQEGGGLFGRGNVNDSDGWFRTFFNLEGEEEGDINNYGIGEEVPLGSGVVIMLAAGLGYWATNKKKEDEQ